ncbi:MAG: c-type cytochrome [Solirubrobacterales bacterium]
MGRARRLLAAVALAASTVVIATAAAVQTGAAEAEGSGGDPTGTVVRLPDPAEVERGRELFLQGCSSCHGFSANGLDGIAPSLQSAGAGSADFYLRTGRMPLSAPGDQPIRSDSRYSEDEIDALVAYIGSLGDGEGPPVPEVDPAAGDLGEGRELFTEYCAGCHQAVARGGIAPGGFAPALTESTPTQVGEAIRVGPYIMPNFSETTITDDEVNSIARYVEWSTGDEIVHPGGWGLGFLGPIPEGLAAWFLALAVLLVVARVIGERTTPTGADGSRLEGEGDER